MLQINLLGGSEKKYLRVSENLKALKFEPYLAEEQFKLYQWREDFFHSKVDIKYLVENFRVANFKLFLVS